MLKLYTLAKQKLTDPMVRVSASSRILTKSFQGSLSTASFKDTVSCILPQEITTLANSSLTRKRAVVCTDGPANSRTCMKASSRLEKETAAARSGGPMVAGTKESLRTEFNVGRESSSVKQVPSNTKAAGRTVCLTARESSTLIMANDTKVTSRRTSSMGKECFIRMTPSFTGCGKTTNCP
jgi:hypothetical protein